VQIVGLIIYISNSIARYSNEKKVVVVVECVIVFVSLSLSEDIQKHTAGEWGKVACRVCVLPPFSNPSEALVFLPVYWKLNVKKKGYSDS